MDPRWEINKNTCSSDHFQLDWKTLRQMKMASIIKNRKEQTGKDIKPNVKKKERQIQDVYIKDFTNHFTETFITIATECIPKRQTTGK